MYRILYALLILMVACSPAEEKKRNFYFDTEDFTHQLVSQMVGSTIEKKVSHNNKFESFKLDATDTSFWERELQVLKACNLNKSAFLGNYDTLSQSNQTRYLALNPKYPVKEMLITKGNDGKLESIKVDFIRKTLLFWVKRKLEYRFRDARLYYYQVNTTKKVIFMDSLKFEIEGKTL
jgi:hypothetical protein